MWKSLVLAAAVAVSLVGSASAQSVESCEDAGITLNAVTALRPYANGSVKLFTTDREEPAVSPMGIAITIDRGDNLENLEGFCRYVGNLSSVDVSKGKARYDEKKALLTVTVPSRRYNSATDSVIDGTLTLVIDKAAKAATGLVKSSWAEK